MLRGEGLFEMFSRSPFKIAAKKKTLEFIWALAILPRPAGKYDPLYFYYVVSVCEHYTQDD